MEMCQPLIQNREHRIELNLPPDPIYLNADSVRLAQVFSNLLNNACKFTDSKGRIELTAVREGNDVLVTVKDNGIGIPPEMLTKVFEMFTQINSLLERTHGGLGIGLTLVQRLVEMHGGSLTARSKVAGTGSEFVVCIPVLLEPIHSEETEAPADPGVTHARRILVVDDNRDSASSLSMLLKLTGNDTAMAHDGEEAVERAEVYQPDVILLDLGLPKRNGYDACRIIRQQPWGREILMIALTGWGQEEDRRKTKEAGFDGHLVKPVSFDELVKLLSESTRKINP